MPSSAVERILVLEVDEQDLAGLRLAALHRALDLGRLEQRRVRVHLDLELAAGGLVDVGRRTADVLGVEVGGRVRGRQVPLGLGGGGQRDGEADRGGDGGRVVSSGVSCRARWREQGAHGGARASASIFTTNRAGVTRVRARRGRRGTRRRAARRRRPAARSRRLDRVAVRRHVRALEHASRRGRGGRRRAGARRRRRRRPSAPRSSVAAPWRIVRAK